MVNLQWRALKFDAVVNLLSAVVVQTGARGQAPVERKIETTQKTRLADSAAGRSHCRFPNFYLSNPQITQLCASIRLGDIYIFLSAVHR